MMSIAICYWYSGSYSFYHLKYLECNKIHPLYCCQIDNKKITYNLLAHMICKFHKQVNVLLFKYFLGGGFIWLLIFNRAIASIKGSFFQISPTQCACKLSIMNYSLEKMIFFEYLIRFYNAFECTSSNLI